MAPLWARRRFSEVNIVALRLDTLLHLPVFKTGALNHSATLPTVEILMLSAFSKPYQLGVASVLLTFPENWCTICARNVLLWRVKAKA